MILTGLLWAAALSSTSPMAALEMRTTTWPDGRTRSAGAYLRDARHGEFRSWHANGTLAEVRHYVDGREAGRQQSWTPEGVLFLNYEVRNGRRYGLVNSRPCVPGGDAGSEVM
jgi:antitoxin component YwqK of YwqJK toxin-antitoxin module